MNFDESCYARVLCENLQRSVPVKKFLKIDRHFSKEPIERPSFFNDFEAVG